jgi:MFS family permease
MADAARDAEARKRAAAARKATRATVRAVGTAAAVARGQIVERIGGPARARVITLFGCVLALSTADASTIGAVAPQLLKSSWHIGELGLASLSTVTLLVGAVFVIPVGMLVDRVQRMPLLSASILLWSVASFASALSPDYTSLLLTRLALGAVTATAGPAIASLTGDYFPAKERGRVYAYILAGEVAGTALGFIVSGTVASVISWRAAFVLLAIPGLFLARALYRTVPEPLRGGQSYLEPGVEDLHEAMAAMRHRAAEPVSPDEAPTRVEEIAHQAVRRRGLSADPRLVLHEDPDKMPIGRAIRYMLQIPSNVLLILGSSLGYFYFAGLSTFAVQFVVNHYHVAQVTAELVLVMLVLGAIGGTLLSGRVSDSLVRRGLVESRVLIPAVCYLGSVALLIPGILTHNLGAALWFDVGGAALLSAANPPLNAARLDIMPSGLWGRAESIRTFVRSIFQALAPLIFAGIADLVVGITPTPGVGTHLTKTTRNAYHAATGLQWSFLILLATLAAAGVFLARARHSYPVDVATAAASQA